MRKVSRRRLAQVVVSLLAEKQADRKHVLQMLAAYLVMHKQQKQADLVLFDIARELAATQGHLYAGVSSAFPLDAPTRAELQQYLTRHTGATSVELDESIDESLLSGVVVKTADQELDTSARTKLIRLSNLHLTTPQEARGESK